MIRATGECLRPVLAASVGACLVLCQGSPFSARAGEVSRAAPIPATALVPSGPPALPAPGAERADLEIPEELWDAVRRQVHAGQSDLGYTAEEMGFYTRSAFLLPAALQLFRDARAVPRFSGKLSDDLLADAEKTRGFGFGWDEGGLAETAARCYALLGAPTGRRTTPDTLAAPGEPFPMDAETRTRWSALPAAVRDLVARLYLAAEEVRPWLLAAYGSGEPGPTPDLYDTAMAHQTDERLGQLATLRADTFRLFETVDTAYLGYATVLWLRHVEYALRSFHRTGGVRALPRAGVDGFVMPTGLGKIVIGGTASEEHAAAPPGQAPLLLVDLGGDDTYGPGLATSSGPDLPVALLIDLDGDDRYLDPAAGDTTAPAHPSFGAGIFGLGALLDLSGDDEYSAGESGLGRGCFGSGWLVDFAGEDRYSGGRWTQGAAHAGVGVLLDLGGDDDYSCGEQSQGLGGTLGVGLLLDLAGNDGYVARDDGNVSALYLDQSVAMSQGCGYGRRADLGDGHSLAGGFGLLVDGGGDDAYHAQVWSQGAGYWWGVGILEDRGGDDRYRNGKYSSGAAAHFAIGVHVDLAGDDVYNEGNETAKNQFQGHARDGSLGIFVDGAGDDRYELRSHCGGSGDLGSIGLFWDRLGTDRYRYVVDPQAAGDWAGTPPLGSTTQYEPFRSFRDDLPTYGIFLDTQGEDDYGSEAPGSNGEIWTMNRYRKAFGLGIDASVFEQPSTGNDASPR